jgi:hypothetical protein
MGKMYVLMGETGDYDDRIKWIAGVFHCMHKACLKSDRLNLILKKYGMQMHRSQESSPPVYSQKNILKERFSKLERNFCYDWCSGSQYYIEVVKVFDEYTQNKGDNS